MSVKSLFSNYIRNKQIVILCDREIKLKRMELLPANISQLSLAPGPHSGNSSPTERTTIKIVLDSDIEYWDKKKKQAQLDIDTVDKLLTLMDEDTRKVLSKRFCEGKRIKDIGIECDYSESQVYRMISEALDSEL